MALNFSKMKVKVCQCEQCKAVKNKRKNRKTKAIIRRYLNKKRRQNKDKYVNFYWS